MYRVTLLCGALAVFCQAYPHDSYSYLPQRGRAEEWVSQTQVGEKQELEGWQKQKLAEIDELLSKQKSKSVYAERDAYAYGADTDVVSSPLRPTYVYTSPIRNSVFSPLERSSFLPLRLADNRLQTTDSLLRNPLAPASLADDYIRTNPLRLATDALTGSTPLTRAQEVLSRSSPLAALEASTPLSRLEDINVFRGRIPSEADSLFRSSLLRPLEENVLPRRPFSPLEEGFLRTSPLRRGVGLLGDRLYPDNSILSSAVSPLLRAETTPRQQTNPAPCRQHRFQERSFENLPSSR
ncbi:uncharacterized protein LOC112576981 [Pomacea canaliculata]|uniref:uncharacterized protein LOC112576981 n=1 Tax=Pomacea canaliculata TaxID=400727 RepID=UPI000D735405|nr:uncharacterized protein LOC112576981 [Pomacea canaliculata]